MYIPRLLLPTLKEALRSFPAVLVTGPRQAGKTTFLVREFGEKSVHRSAFEQPRHPLARIARLAVIHVITKPIPGSR